MQTAKDFLIGAIGFLKRHGITVALLLIYAVSLPLMKTPKFPLLGQRLQLSEICFLFLFIFWLEDLIRNREIPQDTGLNKPFLFFIFFCLLSFFQSQDLFLSTIELLGIIYLFVMFTLVVDVVDTKQKLDTVIKFWIGTLATVLALGLVGLCLSAVSGQRNIFCRVYDEIFPYLKNVYRVQSTFRHPSALANYLIVSFGLVASELLLTENKRYKLFLKSIVSFMCLLLLATVSREILAFMLSCFLIYNHFYQQRSARFKIACLLFILGLAILFLFVAFSSSFYIRSYKVEKTSLIIPQIDIDYGYDVHLVKKLAALEMINRHPFLGVGLAMYPSYVQRLNNANYFKNFLPIHYYPLGYIDFLPAGDPHNDVLGYLAETGILGGGAFILFILTFLYMIVTNLKEKDNRYLQARLFCFFASFIGVLIESIDLDVFKLRHVWFLMALILSVIMIDKRAEPQPEKTHVNMAALLRMSLMKNYNEWIYDKIKPLLGKKILELGSGLGRISQYLALEGREVILTDIDNECISYLNNRFKDNPRVKTIKMDICDVDKILKDEKVDTVVGVNIMEHIKDDLNLFIKIRNILDKDGRLLLITSAHQALYSKFDKIVGHYRRYSKKELSDKLEKSNFTVEKIEYMNFFSAIGWFINFRILKRRHISPSAIWLIDKIIPLIAKTEKYIHFSFGLSLFAVARNEK